MHKASILGISQAQVSCYLCTSVSTLDGTNQAAPFLINNINCDKISSITIGTQSTPAPADRCKDVFIYKNFRLVSVER